MLKSSAMLPLLLLPVLAPARNNPYTLAREQNHLVLRAPQVPGGEIRVNYIEAYCRAGSTDADWVSHTVIGHTSRLVSVTNQATRMVLEDTLKDGVVVTHTVQTTPSGARIEVEAHNPTGQASGAIWAQPCVRLGVFTGYEPPAGPDLDDYLPKCFVLMDGAPARLPLNPWAKQARYTPGQVWGAPGVDPRDLNPRPHSPLRPSHGLIGCFSADETWLFATAWEPYQELFQGVARCLHSDFRIGGLGPGERRKIRGRLYLLPNDPNLLMALYRREFPEHFPPGETAPAPTPKPDLPIPAP